MCGQKFSVSCVTVAPFAAFVKLHKTGQDLGNRCVNSFAHILNFKGRLTLPLSHIVSTYSKRTEAQQSMKKVSGKKMSEPPLHLLTFPWTLMLIQLFNKMCKFKFCRKRRLISFYI